MAGCGRQGAFPKNTGRPLINTNERRRSLNGDQETKANTNSRESSRRPEAGLDSEAAKYWQAGNELGQELRDRETKERLRENIQRESDSPLFLKDTLDGHKGNAQDEKDKSAE
jgi:hypothetical protein